MLLLVVNLVEDSPHGFQSECPNGFLFVEFGRPVLQSAKSWFKKYSKPARVLGNKVTAMPSPSSAYWVTLPSGFRAPTGGCGVKML